MSQIQDNIRKAEGDALDAIEVFIERVCLKIISDASSIIQKGTGHGDISDSGKLKGGLTSVVVRELGRITGIVGVAADVQTPDNKPYPVFVHEGTRPHFPPLQPLQQWVHRRGIAKGSAFRGAYDIKSRRRIKVKTSMKRVEYAIALAIARKIARQGTKGLPFLRLAMNQNIGWIEAEAAKVTI